jgi:predicted metal-dependent phosphoesterase TrpH
VAPAFAESSDQRLAGASASSSGRGPRWFADLHTHSSASFDSLASASALVRTAARRGLTHLAITDHDRIDGAIKGQRLAATLAPELTVIVGQELRTTGGDMIALFINRPIPPLLSPGNAIAAVRDQGGLVGIPHPFDRLRGSLLRDGAMEDLLGQVDWIETHNARALGGRANERAVELAAARGLPGIAVSDSHSAFEVGVAYTILEGDLSTPEAFRAALPTAEIVRGQTSLYLRFVTPIAKIVQRARGNGRVRPTPEATESTVL